MKADNIQYDCGNNPPERVALFPLDSVLLLPGNYLPLRIFEPRYLKMVKDVMAKDRIIGIIQPIEENQNVPIPLLQKTGCLGRITSYNETENSHILIGLQGVCRFTIAQEMTTNEPYRMADITSLHSDLKQQDQSDLVDRAILLATFKNFLGVAEMEADWNSITQESTQTLVNVLSMITPFGIAEKQALLEATDVSMRAQILIALAERFLMKYEHGNSLN